MATQNPEPKLRQLTRRLPVIAEQNPAIREEALSLFRAVNDNVGTRLSAGDAEEDQGE